MTKDHTWSYKQSQNAKQIHEYVLWPIFYRPVIFMSLLQHIIIITNRGQFLMAQISWIIIDFITRISNNLHRNPWDVTYPVQQ